MVDSVQHSNMAKLRLLQGQGDARVQSADAAQSSGRVSSSGPAEPTRQTDITMLDRAAAIADRGPSFDAGKVDQIKQALSEGRYPLDVERLTESLFQDYEALRR